MRYRSSYFHLVVFVLLASFSSALQAEQEVYRWVDDDGVVHFADRPVDPRAQRTGLHFESTNPDSVQKRLMQRDYEENQAAASETEQAESAAIEATRRAEEARTRDLQCNAARERYQVYTTAPQLYETLPGGERRYLTENELAAAREEAQADVDKWCD